MTAEYALRILGGLAACLITTFAAGAWAATLVIAAAMSLTAVVVAHRLPDAARQS
jgi:hypothetical protein